MLDIPSISAAVAAVGVIVGVAFTALQLRDLGKTRQTDLVIRLYSKLGSKARERKYFALHFSSGIPLRCWTLLTFQKEFSTESGTNLSGICWCFDKREIVELTSRISRVLKKKKNKKKSVPPSSYSTMPHYFPTEQVDIVRKLKSKRRIRRRKTK